MIREMMGKAFGPTMMAAGIHVSKKWQGGNFINFEPDFGKSISQAFFFQTNLVGVEEFVSNRQFGFQVFPNPSDAQFNVRLDGWNEGQLANWSLRDPMGRLIDQGARRLSSGELLAAVFQGMSTGDLRINGHRCDGTTHDPVDSSEPQVIQCFDFLT